MKKYALCITLFVTTLTVSIVLYMMNTSNERVEIKRLANENYKLRGEIMRLKITDESKDTLILSLKNEIETMEGDLLHLTELEDFEHYKMIKSHILNPLTMGHSYDSKLDDKTHAEEELVIVLSEIVDMDSFENLVEGLAKEDLIVVDHLTRSFERLIKNDERTDEFIEYIHEFRVRVTTEESYILSRLKCMLMS